MSRFILLPLFAAMSLMGAECFALDKDCPNFSGDFKIVATPGSQACTPPEESVVWFIGVPNIKPANEYISHDYYVPDTLMLKEGRVGFVSVKQVGCRSISIVSRTADESWSQKEFKATFEIGKIWPGLASGRTGYIFWDTDENGSPELVIRSHTEAPSFCPEPDKCMSGYAHDFDMRLSLNENKGLVMKYVSTRYDSFEPEKRADRSQCTFSKFFKP